MNRDLCALCGKPVYFGEFTLLYLLYLRFSCILLWTGLRAYFQLYMHPSTFQRLFRVGLSTDFPSLAGEESWCVKLPCAARSRSVHHSSAAEEIHLASTVCRLTGRRLDSKNAHWYRVCTTTWMHLPVPLLFFGYHDNDGCLCVRCFRSSRFLPHGQLHAMPSFFLPFPSLVLFLSFVSSPPLLSAPISHRLLTCTQRRQRIPSSRVDGRSGVDGLVNTKSVPIVPIVQTVQLLRDDWHESRSDENDLAKYVPARKSHCIPWNDAPLFKDYQV